MKTCSRPMSQRSLRVSLTLTLALALVGELELLLEASNLLLVLDDHVDARDGGAHARLQDLLGKLFLVEGDDFLDVAHAAAQVFAQPRDLADHDGRARDCLHHAELPALDALGDLDFALAREQGDGAHLAQVHAHGVVGFFERSGRKIELYVLGLFAGLGLVLVAPSAAVVVIAAELDALGVDGGEQVVEVVGRGDVAGQQVVDLAEGEVTLFLAYFDNLVFIRFEFFSHVRAHSCVRISGFGAATRAAVECVVQYL